MLKPIRATAGTQFVVSFPPLSEPGVALPSMVFDWIWSRVEAEPRSQVARFWETQQKGCNSEGGHGGDGHRMGAATPGRRRRRPRRRRDPSAPAAAAASPCAPCTAAGPTPPPHGLPPTLRPSALPHPQRGAAPPAPRPRTSSGLLPAHTAAFCTHAYSRMYPRSRVAASRSAAFHV